MENLPGNCMPSEATHRYGLVLYKVRLQRNIKKFYEKVWYWDLKANSWIRTFCNPSVKKMTRI